MHIKFLKAFFLLIVFSSSAQNVDPEVLKTIISRSEETHSDALMIQKGDEILASKGEVDETIYIASAGKSLVNLAIGKLLDEGFLDSLDQPIYTLYPEWKQGNKQLITVRMLLNHTSGLQDHVNASLELEPPPDYKVDNVVQLALAAELDNLPGEEVFYSNKAVALLGGVIERASGKRMDRFFEEYFFEPMNITDVDWVRDRSDNPTAHGAFIIKPSDLLKFGELLLSKGEYQGIRILSEDWIDLSLKQSQDKTPIWGLLWWRLPEFERRIIDKSLLEVWKEKGASNELIRKVGPLVGKEFEGRHDYFEAMRSLLGDQWGKVLQENNVEGSLSSRRIYSDNIVAYYADGFRGNYLVIIPEKEIVAVRCADHDGFNYQTDGFRDFVRLISQL